MTGGSRGVVPGTPDDVAHDPYGALRVPAFRWFVVSLMAMTIGIQIQGIAVAWQLYTATNDPLTLGLAGLAEVVPFMVLSLPAGHWADRHDRKQLALIGIGVLVLCAALFLGMTGGLHGGGAASSRVVGSTSWSSPAVIYAVLAVSGVARAILQPARQALATMIVPTSLYVNAATWRSSIWQFASVLGPAIGGLLFAFAGALPTYAVTLTLLLLSLAGMSMVRVPAQVARVATSSTAGGTGILEGVRFVLRDKLVLAALSLDMFAVLFGGATALLPVFTTTVLHVSPEWLGYLRASPAVGAMAMALVIAHQPVIERAGRTLLLAVAVWGLSIIGFALSRDVWLSCALLAMGGAVDSISVVIRSTLLQTRTPPHVMGRVMAVNSIFIGSANEIGAFESGVTAKLFGAVNSVLIGGVATLVVVLTMAVSSPTLRRLGRMNEPETTR
ncbi:MAG TPA: MFS transporter [Gemmatimonadaceae bacterium]|nr:MFS transporter [Gemmatimonadaceae bacterium]